MAVGRVGGVLAVTPLQATTCDAARCQGVAICQVKVGFTTLSLCGGCEHTFAVDGHLELKPDRHAWTHIGLEEAAAR